MFLINPYILQASGNPLWDGLTAYYTADNTPNDALGTYNGTLVNGATYGTGIINQGFSFDGVNDYFDIGNDTFAPTGDFTISFWVNFNSLSGWFCNIGTYSTNQGILFYIAPGNKLISIISNSSNFIIQSPSMPTVTTGTWYHVVLSYSSTSVKYYIDGFDYAGVTPPYAPAYPTPCPNTFGAANGGTTNFCNCLMDEIALFDGRQLSDAEVTELYNLGAAKQYPN